MRINGDLRLGLLGGMVALAFGGSVRLAGQQPAGATPTLNVDARLVNLPVVVRDKKGALVQNLTKDSFVLQVDGHAQTVRYFNLDTDLPLTLGLLVDTSMSQREVLDEERKASSGFIDDMLTGPAGRDTAYVIQFAKQIDLLQDVTSSKPKLQAAVKQLETAAEGESAGGGGTDAKNDSDSRARRGGGTALYDSLFLASDEVMSKQKGRKAVVILSDGDDRGSKESLNEAIEAAQRADTIVYAIYFKGKDVGGGGNDRDRDRGQQGGGYPGGRGGSGYPGGGGGYPGGVGGYPGGGQGGGRGGPGRGQESRTDGKKILERMANETGGRMFEVTKKETVAAIYAEIGEELRSQYRLGFTPEQAALSEGYHKIELSLTKSSPKDSYVQTREGYYTGK